MIPLQLARENHAELSAGRARGAPGRAASPKGNETPSYGIGAIRVALDHRVERRAWAVGRLIELPGTRAEASLITLRGRARGAPAREATRDLHARRVRIDVQKNSGHRGPALARERLARTLALEGQQEPRRLGRLLDHRRVARAGDEPDG